MIVLRHLVVMLLCLIACPFGSYAAELENISVKSEFSNGFSRLSRESADLLTTPVQRDNGNIFITLGIAGAIATTYVFDTSMRDKLGANHSSSMNKAADAGSLTGDPFIHLGLAAALYGGAIAADSAKWKEVGEMLGEALILADGSTLILKEATGRGRPVATTNKGDFKPFQFKTDYDSFPSMHTASSFAMASIMAATSENMATKLLYYGAATFVGFSRMYQNKHWASDVVTAAALGELCGRVVMKTHVGQKNMSFVPQLFEKGGGMAMVAKW